MDLRLQNRTALITGASHGIGKAIAQAFAREGAGVVMCARNKVHLMNAWIDMKSYAGVTVYGVQVDVTKPEEVTRLFANWMYGGPDILVNNVGGAEQFGDFFSLSDEDWHRAYELNFMSVVHMCREAIPWLKKSDCARIINISSLPAHQPGRFNPHYSAAKAAVENLTKYLGNFLAEDNILVNAVAPSTIKGGGWERNVVDRALRDGIFAEEAEKRMETEESKKSPLGRIGTLEDVANTVLFLASPLNNYITGSVIDVDGGIRRGVR